MKQRLWEARWLSPGQGLVGSVPGALGSESGVPETCFLGPPGTKGDPGLSPGTPLLLPGVHEAASASDRSHFQLNRFLQVEKILSFVSLLDILVYSPNFRTT